jgi:hypothetical protein
MDGKSDERKDGWTGREGEKRAKGRKEGLKPGRVLGILGGLRVWLAGLELDPNPSPLAFPTEFLHLSS